MQSLLMVCSQVPEEEANDHNRLAQEVPVQEDWNPECPTGPPPIDHKYFSGKKIAVKYSTIAGSTSCKYPEED